MPDPELPSVRVAIKVQPSGAPYDVLDAAANGAYFVDQSEIGKPRTGDLEVPVRPALVSRKEMSIRVSVKGAAGSIRASVFAWSSKLDNAGAARNGWIQIDETKSGTEVLTFEDGFDPVP